MEIISYSKKAVHFRTSIPVEHWRRLLHSYGTTQAALWALRQAFEVSVANALTLHVSALQPPRSRVPGSLAEGSTPLPVSSRAAPERVEPSISDAVEGYEVDEQVLPADMPVLDPWKTSWD